MEFWSQAFRVCNQTAWYNMTVLFKWSTPPVYYATHLEVEYSLQIYEFEILAPTYSFIFCPILDTQLPIKVQL